MSILTSAEYRRLLSGEFDSYARAALPNSHDRELAEIVDRLIDHKSFATTSAQLEASQRGVFGVFAWRAAMVAVPNGDEVMVRRAIVAAARALCAPDNIDMMLYQPLPFRSAEILGMDIAELMDEVAQVLPDDLLRVAHNNAQCDDLAVRVRAMCVDEVGTGPSFRYELLSDHERRDRAGQLADARLADVLREEHRHRDT